MKNCLLFLSILCFGFAADVGASESLIITSPRQGATVSGIVQMRVQAQASYTIDSIAFISRYVRANGRLSRQGSQVHGIDERAPYSATLDTREMRDGEYVIYACANMDISTTQCGTSVLFVDNSARREQGPADGPLANARPQLRDDDSEFADEALDVNAYRQSRRRGARRVSQEELGADPLLRIDFSAH